jgi:hypothetical protein
VSDSARQAELMGQTLDPCLQSMAKMSNTVHGLAQSAPSVQVIRKCPSVLVSVAGVRLGRWPSTWSSIARGSTNRCRLLWAAAGVVAVWDRSAG